MRNGTKWGGACWPFTLSGTGLMSSPLSGLVVEDEWLLRLELVEELTSVGWSVREAASGETALKAIADLQAEGQSVDFLVTDIRLGGAVDGWAVAQTFRQAWPTAAVIYVSANPVMEKRRVADSVVLSKPVEIETLLLLCRKLTMGAP